MRQKTRIGREGEERDETLKYSLYFLSFDCLITKKASRVHVVDSEYHIIPMISEQWPFYFSSPSSGVDEVSYCVKSF